MGRFTRVLQLAFLSLGSGAVAAIISASVFEQRAVIVTVLLSMILVPAFTLLSGNARLLCLWALIVTLPLNFSKFFGTLPHMGGEYAFRIDVFTDTFLGLLSLAWLYDIARGYGLRFHIPKPFYALVALAILALIDAINGPWHRLAAMEVVRMAKVGVLFLFTANQLIRPGHFRHVLIAITTGCMLQAIYGLLQYFLDLNLGLTRLGESSLLQMDVGGRTASRVTALMGHPNLLSGYLCLVMPAPLALLFAPVGFGTKIYAFFTLMASQATLILTLSRNGWASFFVAACIVMAATILHPAIRYRTSILRIAIVTATIAVLVIASPMILNRLLKSNPDAVEARFDMNRSALLMIAERPILGFGKNSYAYSMMTFPQFRPGKASIYRETVYDDPRTVPPIHNIYLQQWVEQGTVGFIIFMLMLGYIIRTGIRNLRIRDEFLYMTSVAALAGIVAILVHGLADWVYWWSGITRVFWVLAGIVYAIHHVSSHALELEESQQISST